MAKKTVAGYRDKSKVKSFTKIIRSVKDPKTGNYTFKEDVVPTDMVNQYLKDNK